MQPATRSNKLRRRYDCRDVQKPLFRAAASLSDSCDQFGFRDFRPIQPWCRTLWLLSPASRVQEQAPSCHIARQLVAVINPREVVDLPIRTPEKPICTPAEEPRTGAPGPERPIHAHIVHWRVGACVLECT